MRKSNRGFTLVELAIVLIIIGLILGMVFKGRQLIDSAKVKHLVAQYNKIQAAVNTFYERYGFYPGDGCNSPAPNSVSDCGNTKNGVLNTDNEKAAFWHLLINVTHILSAGDRKSSIGVPWQISSYGNVRGRNGNYLYFSQQENSFNAASVPVKYICVMDQMVDDGEATSGDILFVTGDPYDPGDDCWSISSQSANARIYILP